MIIQDSPSGILYRRWDVVPAQASVVLVHGLGGHSARWEFLAQFLRRRNVDSYAIELKGFGQTPDLKGHIDSFDTYYRDIRSLCGIAKADFPGKKIFLVGESLGGLLVFHLAAQSLDLCSGLICIAPAFKSTLPLGALRRLQMSLALLVSPKMQFKMPLDSALCTRDTHYLSMMQQDPREHRLASAKFLFNTVAAQKNANKIKAKIRVPVLFLLPGRDAVVDSAASRLLFDRLVLEDKTIIEYPDMVHALPIDLEREKVFADIADWITPRII